MAITKTVPLLMLSNELNRLKAESKVSNPEAAQHLGCAATKINRILTMTSKPTVGDVKLLAEKYGASPELTDVLVDLARNLGRKGDWTGYRALYPGWLRMLISLEQYSGRIRIVQSEIIPGLLQTEGYVRALHEAPTPFGNTSNVDDAVRARRERQEIITRDDNRPMLSFVLSESSLRRVFGSKDVMREQMEHLLDTSRLANVQLQVLPFANASPVTHASVQFALLHVPGPGIAAPLNFVYVEQYDDARYLDDQARVEAYEQLWGHLQAAALGPVESADFIGKVAEEYK
ncbi:DUF5753 domain-containing protein [Saccharopolyspora pogona]|uniref:DUF5753 domain-containing protein n=1 Tax=Saccharopolyspora pogona TaxID=333966 RepID=UPI001689BA03|nr:DUF5753 domain-containing protein [Saccharopolyspora pogona]